MIAKQLYPFESHYLPLHGSSRLHYVDEGSGEPIVMVHGNPTWSFYYRDLIKTFAKDHRVVALDHMGCGLSDLPPDNYNFTLEQRVLDLTQLIESLGLKNITLVVHDWGGMIGFTYATRFPANIKRLVVFNSAAFKNPKDLKLPFSIRLCRTPAIGAFVVKGLNGFCRGAMASCCTYKKLSRSEQKAYLAPYSSWQKRRAVHEFVANIPLTPDDQAWPTLCEVEERLPLLKEKPLLMVWGAKDFVFDDSFLYQWQQHFPKAQVHRLPEAGHFVVEDATDEIKCLMKDFISNHP